MGNEYKDRTVRNNGKRIGKTRSYENNIRKLKKYRVKRAIATAAIISFIGGIGAGVGGTKLVETFTKDTIQVETANGTKGKVYGAEPRYDGIPYTIRSGETLSGIIYSYETDADLVKKYMSEICRLNDIDNASSIKDNQTILLCGVPSSKLENYGYTDNYNYFEPEVEVDDRLEFISGVLNDMEENAKENVALQEYYDNDTLQTYYDNLNDRYHDYLDSRVNEEDEDKIDDILEELRDVCQFISDKYQVYSFDKNKKAMPLSEATRNIEDSYAR